MKHLDALITIYVWGLITHDELEALVFKEAFIATAEISGLNSSEFLEVLDRIGDEYATYVAEQLGD